jgi:hypothetical protein
MQRSFADRTQGAIPIVSRSSLAWVLGLSLAWSSASADAAASVDIQQFRPAPGKSALLHMHGPEIPPHLEYQLGLFLNYGRNPLVARQRSSGDVVREIVDDQAAMDFFGSVGLYDLVEVGLQLPIRTHHVETTAEQSIPGLTSGRRFGLGDIRLVPKVHLYSTERLRLAAALGLVLPTGRGDFLGQGSAGMEPRFILDANTDTIRWVANFGFNIRPARQLADLRVHHELSLSAGAEIPFQMGPRPAQALLALSGLRSLGKGTSHSLEGLAGARAPVIENLSATLGFGAGIVAGYGTPSFRVLLGIGWTPPSAAPSKKPEAPKSETWPGDEPWPEPAAPKAPEPPAAKPAPEAPKTPADTDRDGVPNDRDLCPDDAGDDPNGDGCPADDDKDGIINIYDHCPNDPETFNGHRDEDGCPDAAPPARRPGKKGKVVR